MRPTHLSRLIIDGFQHSLAKDSVVCPSPAVLTVLGLREIDTVGIPRADDEQPGLGVKTRRAVICRAASSGAISRPSRAGSFAGLGIGRPFLSTPADQLTAAKVVVRRLLPVVRSSTKK